MMKLYDYLIPLIVYLIILLVFGFTIFKWALLVGLIFGFFALIWLFLEKDPKWNQKFEKIEKKIRKSFKKFWDLIWN